jgi:hypothetical protein
MGLEVELQIALFDRLSSTLIGVAGVYDRAPQAADSGAASAFPYVTIGNVILTELDTQTKNGWSALCRVHTYSRSGEHTETKGIQGQIYDALHRAPLTISGALNYSCKREDSDVLDDMDSKVHGVCEYRALIETA